VSKRHVCNGSNLFRVSLVPPHSFPAPGIQLCCMVAVSLTSLFTRCVSVCQQARRPGRGRHLARHGQEQVGGQRSAGALRTPQQLALQQGIAGHRLDLVAQDLRLVVQCVIPHWRAERPACQCIPAAAQAEPHASLSHCSRPLRLSEREAAVDNERRACTSQLCWPPHGRARSHPAALRVHTHGAAVQTRRSLSNKAGAQPRSWPAGQLPQHWALHSRQPSL